MEHTFYLPPVPPTHLDLQTLIDRLSSNRHMLHVFGDRVINEGLAASLLMGCCVLKYFVADGNGKI
jgi:hypothetical protein